MYRTKQQRDWDNRNAFDFAREEGHEQGAKKIAKNLKINNIDLKIIAGATGLSIEEIIAL